MSDPAYDHIGTPPDRLVEECSELILAIQKAKRFGWFNHHPDRPTSNNLKEVLLEMADVETAIGKLRAALTE